MKSLALVLLLLIAAISSCQQPSAARLPGLQVEGAGRIYVSVLGQLHRLNSDLQLEETRNLNSEAVNISLSSDGRWLVVCLTDLSCEVYNAINFSAGHVFRRENVITLTQNIALFATEDSFYVGGTTVDADTGAQQQMFLGQYGFAESRISVAESQIYSISRDQFERNFYGGFVKGSYAYYLAVDSDPRDVRDFKILRVCHNSNFSALYELSLGCAGVAPGPDVRISGISVVEDFAGTSGTTVVLSRNRPGGSTHNFACFYSLEMIDSMMQSRFQLCSMATIGTSERIDLAWREQSENTFCDVLQSTSNICRFQVSAMASPLALDDFERVIFNGEHKISLGSSQNPNYITASVAVVVDSFSFIFVAFTELSGDSFIIGFDASAPGVLIGSDGFDRRPVTNGPVRQLQWLSGTEFIYAITNTSVIQLSVADCSSRTDCTSCLGNGNPLCGWCVVENECSKLSECQNSQTSGRWIWAAGSNTDQCPTITISPEQYVVDDPQILTLTLSQDLPILLENETYLCHFASSGNSLVVDAVGSGRTYTCNITDRLSSQFETLATAFDVSLASSLLGIPFSTNVGGLTVYRCGATPSCSQCLQTNNACGWCVYNKVCSGTSASCINGIDNFLQLNLVMSQTYLDVCPLLDQPSPGVNYQQPVLVNKNIELVTRNLPPEIAGFNYMCRVNGVNLLATYNNKTSLTCSVNMNDLPLPSGVGQQSVDVTIQWVGQNINHPIDAVTPVSVILYNCVELADSCSSCLGSEFECGWCDRPNGMTDTCTYTDPGGCDATPVTEGANCPGPMITDFNPKFGPPEGGTTITITGTDLGVSFSDFTAPGSSITVGGATCAPANPENYMPGQRIDCITTDSGGSTGSEAMIIITIPNGRVNSMNTLFTVVSPRITSVVPSRGPQAGGTRLTVYGSDLNIGNIEDTRITVTNGTGCTVDQGSIQATNITCTTLAFTDPATGPVMVMIDSATINNNSVQFTYTPNPEFYSVTPTNTILGGGIELIFNGTNLDVVQNPMLVINDPEYLNVINNTHCTVLNSMAISCVTPPLTRMQSGDSDGVNYTILIDNAPGPDLTVMSLQINVLPNPGNFKLVDNEYNIGSGTAIRIMGTNFNSVDDDDFNVTVGGEICTISGFVTPTQISCEPPQEPPGGNLEATVAVNIGQYLSVQLSTPLSYVSNQASPVPLSLVIIIPVVAGGLLVMVLFSLLIICCVVFLYGRKVRIIKNEQSVTNLISQLELTNLQHEKESVISSPRFKDDQLLKHIPEELIIPSSQLQLSNKPIGQGEFGLVFKARLLNWHGNQLPQAVAVKTVKGLFNASDIESLVAEISKMMDFQHPNVMSLIGVCLDAGPGVSIVMPFMANGSLLDYLKKERATLYLSDIDEIDEVLPVRKLLLRMCYQIAKGMEYLALKKFVHRDLAARNCMLDSSGNVRVGDFGLAEDVYTRGYFRQGKDDAVKLPFKWMAPESLRDGLFSEKSDVWSFGITCWEVFSAGRIPYSGVDAMNMLKILEKGTRLEMPDNIACAPEYFSIMKKCWALNPEDRLGFGKLSSTLGKLIETAAGYLELSMVLLPPEGNEVESNRDVQDSRPAQLTAMEQQTSSETCRVENENISTTSVSINSTQAEQPQSSTVNASQQEPGGDYIKAVDFSREDNTTL